MTTPKTPTRLIETDLRRLIRGLLREADLSGKSLSLVGALVEINRDLEAAGLELEIGLAAYVEANEEQRFEFAARSRARKGEPRGYTLADLREPDYPLRLHPGRPAGA